MLEELISVIIPVYNVENYIDTCIQSVIDQTYSNLEIILVNDGSTDSSSQKCNRWEKEDKRIKVINQSNKGLSGARNTGIISSAGEWIAFIDSDDYVDRTYLKKLYLLAREHGVDIAQCGNGGELLKSREEQIEKGVMTSREFLLSKYYQVMAWGKLYRKTLFHRESFPQGKIHEDVGLIYKLVYKSERVAYTTEKLYFCNLRVDSINSEKSFYLNRLDILQFRKEQLLFFRSNSERELEQKAIRDYAYELLVCYDKTCRILKRKDIARKIKIEYRNIWGILMRDDKISFRTKCLLLICLFYPKIWRLVCR